MRLHAAPPASSLRTVVLAVIMALVVSACTGGGSDLGEVAADPSPSAPASTSSTTALLRVDLVPGLLDTMTVDQKIGQLLMPVVAGRAADEVTETEAASNLAATGYRTPAEIVEAYDLGGIIYISDNIDSAEQVRTLSADLQQVARERVGIGLLVAVDQEGGRVNRITDQVTVFPSAEDLAGDVEAVRDASYVTGQQLQRQGFNVVLAPVADVGVGDGGGFIGDRAYGSDPAVVAEMVAASISGLQQAGVAAAAKHWPGHGATATDSHQELPVVDIDKAGWQQRDMIPFQAAIADKVAIILVGHLALPQLDPTGEPATFSPTLIGDLLRGELGYDGVVMTDALNMGAVDSYDPGEVVVRSVEAGADIMLMSPDLDAARQALRDAVADGRISEANLDQAVGRVLRLKQDLGVLQSPN